MKTDKNLDIRDSFLFDTSKLNLENFFDSMEEIIFVLNFKAEIIYVNSTLLKSLKYSKDELIGESALMMHLPNQHEKVTATIKDMIEGKIETCSIPFFTKDGVIFPVKTKVTQGKWGNIDVLFGISYIMTERMRFEERIINQRKKTEEYLDLVNDIIVALNREGNITLLNKTGYKILEHEEGTLIGKNWFEFCLPQESRSVVYEYFKKLMNNEVEITPFYENLVLTKNGGEKMIAWSTKLFKDLDGKVTGVLSSGDDITERKKAKQELEKSEEKYRMLVENAQEGIWALDAEGRTTFVNPKMGEMLGYSPDEMIGRSLFSFMDEEGIEKAKRNLERRKQGIGEQLESKYIKKDGTKIFASLETSPLFDDKGNYTGALAMVADITGRKIALKALKESEINYRQAYNQANLYKDIFAHDISNILQNIQSSLELSSLYLNNPEKSNTVKELYGIVKEQISRCSKLIYNVRKLSNLQESKSELKPVKIGKLLKESIKFIRQGFSRREIDIQVKSDNDSYYVLANELLLDVIENILINGIRHNSSLKVKIIIKVSKEETEENKSLKLEFVDNGEGIEDKRKKYIFQRGTKEVSSAGGMGLGLSLVKQILDRYNAKIWVEDRIKGDYSQGSNFVVLFTETL